MKPHNSDPLRGLREALRAHPGWSGVRLIPLPDTGLAHLHVRLEGAGVLARIPKQSQLGLAPAANLRHQQVCFERAEPTGHTPRLVGVLPVTRDLPRGALLVEEIVGRPAQLPQDLARIAQALAAVHALALPDPALRAPLGDADDPLLDLHQDIRAQAAYSRDAGLHADVGDAIAAELQALATLVATPVRPPRSLIAFDAHPGNFLVRTSGAAVLVDLEKCRYGPPGLDLAHASLYTSTTWDVAVRAVLEVAEVAAFYSAWEQAMDAGSVRAARPWHVPLRRAMWLWSLTWCCKWRALSRQPPRPPERGEDWSAAISDEALVAHVRERVDHYLSPSAVARVREELRQLAPMLAA